MTTTVVTMTPEAPVLARNCRAGTTCYMFPSGSLVPTNDVASSPMPMGRRRRRRALARGGGGCELGHVVHMQEFNQDDLRKDCSKNGNGWGVTSDEHESCATTESFASYVGAVSWYEPNNTGTTPIGWSLRTGPPARPTPASRSRWVRLSGT